MPGLIDEVGNVHGKLTVIERGGSRHGAAAWLCQCECGSMVTVAGTSLRYRHVRSCGCLRAESLAKILTGRTFGKLTALCQNGRCKTGGFMWLCECDCGNTVRVRTGSLMNGHTRSCGCLPKGSQKLPVGEAAFNSLFTRYKRSAKKRDIEWYLTKEQMKSITKQRCFYCDANPSSEIDGKGLNGKYIYNGIDRLNNDIGYIYGNVVACCKYCNFAKRDRSLKDFMLWIRSVHDHSLRTLEMEDYIV